VYGWLIHVSEVSEASSLISNVSLKILKS
jgi:hypothetical protein